MRRWRIGTVGLAAEWGWSHVWMPLPWPTEILPEVAAFGLATALAASLIGAWIGARLGVRRRLPQLARPALGSGSAARSRSPRSSRSSLYTPSSTTATANVTLRDVNSGADAHGRS